MKGDNNLDNLDKAVNEKKTRKATVIIPNLKAGIKDFIYSSGKVKDIRDVSIIQYNIDDEQIKLCLEITELLINSRLLNDTIKLYLKSNRNNIKGFIKEYNEMLKLNGEKEVSYGGVQSNIYLAEKKLEKIFDMEDPYLFILRYKLNKNNESYIKKYNLLKARVSSLNQIYSAEESKVYSQMLININKEAFSCDLTDEEFETFISSISWYSKRIRDLVQNGITEREAGYFNYLLHSKSLTEEELQKKKRIETIFLPMEDIYANDNDSDNVEFEIEE